jgi:hypothetical protein
MVLTIRVGCGVEPNDPGRRLARSTSITRCQPTARQLVIWSAGSRQNPAPEQRPHVHSGRDRTARRRASGLSQNVGGAGRVARLLPPAVGHSGTPCT